jgi:hypothetical protein
VLKLGLQLTSLKEMQEDVQMDAKDVDDSEIMISTMEVIKQSARPEPD